mmetsp:Transcript_11894/g.31057  ORF Transcript_11894/g.31057 Transcript_11894/m.31057 type:complete len:282 (+) Transcript_11894:289-1134(+)
MPNDDRWRNRRRRCRRRALVLVERDLLHVIVAIHIIARIVLIVVLLVVVFVIIVLVEKVLALRLHLLAPLALPLEALLLDELLARGALLRREGLHRLLLRAPDRLLRSGAIGLALLSSLGTPGLALLVVRIAAAAPASRRLLVEHCELLLARVDVSDPRGELLLSKTTAECEGLCGVVGEYARRDDANLIGRGRLLLAQLGQQLLDRQLDRVGVDHRELQRAVLARDRADRLVVSRGERRVRQHDDAQLVVPAQARPPKRAGGGHFGHFKLRGLGNPLHQR